MIDVRSTLPELAAVVTPGPYDDVVVDFPREGVLRGSCRRRPLLSPPELQRVVNLLCLLVAAALLY